MKLRCWLALAVMACLIAPRPSWALGFHGTHTVDGVDVWAVGDGGVIYRSLNGGLDWTQYGLGNRTLRDVAAVGLTAIVVSDSGKIWRSVDSGGGWALTTVSGAPDLYAVAMPTASVAYVAGATGRILKSSNGGATWVPQTSGTGVTLRALKFTDELNGWAVGDGATALRTTNGGATWTPVPTGASRNLLDVDQFGATVWVVGEDATARKSTNSGSNWTGVDLQLDDLADVKVVRLRSASTMYLAGGGGFIRRSVDGGATWEFWPHSMHAPITDLSWFGSGMWAANSGNRVVMYSTNQGLLWNLPAGASLSRSWDLRLGPVGTVRGGTVQNHPTNKRAFMCAVGDKVWASYDDGENWVVKATMPVGSGAKTNAFLVSPKDTNLWLAAVDSSDVDRVMRTTDGGATWSRVLWGGNGGPSNFGTYGIPLEMHPDKPDTVLFGGDNFKIMRSTNFGATWSTIQSTPATFRSPCDIVIVPGNNSVIHVADGITGSGPGEVWRSTDGGVNFTKVITLPGGNSEVPGMATARLRNTVNFATGWSGGGLRRSTDTGANYTEVMAQSSAWGVDVSRDDPNVVIFGVYTGNKGLLSVDGGDTFTNVSIAGANYTFYARDRATILAEQSVGVYKMRFNYSYTPPSGSQGVTVLSPNGGESWLGGSTQPVTWSSSNLAAARIEYRRAPGEPWNLVAEVPGYLGSYMWTVPNDATTQARIRVRDLWDGAPTDSSNAFFTIATSTALELLAPNGGESWGYGSSQNITWNSSGITQVDLDYESSPGGGWTPIASALPASPATYNWSIPDVPTTQARIRVSQSGGAMVDMSAAPFTLAVARLESVELHHMGGTLPGQPLADTLRIRNGGTAPLVVTSANVDHASFWLGRTSFTIPAGVTDTLGLFYTSGVPSADTASVTLVANHPSSPGSVQIVAYAVTSLDARAEAPASFALWQNQPNPFSEATLIRFALQVETTVALDVFDVQGHRVASLARGARGAGVHAVAFGRGAVDADGRSLSALRAGVYFVRFQAGRYAATRKMLLMR